MRPPPRWLRRVLLAPLVTVLAVVFAVTVPVWVPLGLVLSPLVPGRLRPLRVLWLLAVYLAVEAVALAAMLGLWIGSGFGWRVSTPAFRRAHYRLCGAALRTLYRQACWALRLTVRVAGPGPARPVWPGPPGPVPVAVSPATPWGTAGEPSEPAPRGGRARAGWPGADRPVLVLCRHAGPGDSFLIAHALINWYDRDPRIVLKDALQWDPAIDVLLHRLPNRFIAPGAGTRSERQVATLAATLGRTGALVIFPEGGNFTPRRWERAIERLHRLGLHQMAGRAAGMRNVLAPHPGGVLAALDAAPRADVVFVGHTGADHLLTVGDVWRELPMDKVLVMRWWLESRDAVPDDPAARVEWLYRWWARIDAWISENRPAGAEPGSYI